MDCVVFDGLPRPLSHIRDIQASAIDRRPFPPSTLSDAKAQASSGDLLSKEWVGTGEFLEFAVANE